MKKKIKLKHRVFIIEVPAKIDGRNTILLKTKETKNKFTYYMIICYCKIMRYDYKIV